MYVGFCLVACWSAKKVQPTSDRGGICVFDLPSA